MELFHFCQSNCIEVLPEMSDTTWTTMYSFGISWKWKERMFYWVLPTRRPPTSFLLKAIGNAVRLVRWRYLRAASGIPIQDPKKKDSNRNISNIWNIEYLFFKAFIMLSNFNFFYYCRHYHFSRRFLFFCWFFRGLLVDVFFLFYTLLLYTFNNIFYI
jgi:hypothetical protein